MILEYRTTESTVKPELIDSSSSKKFVYIRRNIVEIETEDGVKYQYEEAKLSNSEYEQYLNEINAGTVMETVEKIKGLATNEVSDTKDLSVVDKLLLLIESIPEEKPVTNGIEFPKKEGFIWKPKYNGTSFVWELVADPDYVPVNDGSDYLKAIIWNEGDPVTEGLWYNVGDNLIWQAKKTGIPESGTDTEYFDIL